MIETDVLIVGGGPVGMGLGLELARHGIGSVIVELNEATTLHPKSRGTTARTMEDFRSWGIEQEVWDGGVDGPDAMWVCESITGRLIGTTMPSPYNIHSPCSKRTVAQDVVERAIAGALAGQTKADLRRSHRFLRYEQDRDGVTGWAEDLRSGEEITFRAKYLIGCDGAGSKIRKSEGIELIGPEIAQMANYYYWADTSRLPQASLGAVFSVHPTDPSIRPARIAPSGPDNERWLWIALYSAEEGLLPDEELIRNIRGHWGVPDLEVRPINSLVWRMCAQVPERLRSGRVLLAGDAAHRFPPAGGMGLNSGIQDARNLGWKLAFVLKGLAGDALLDTYGVERLQIARSNNAWSMGNAKRLPEVEAIVRDRNSTPEALRGALIEQSNHLNSEGQGFGEPYVEGALLPHPDGCPPHDARIYWPSDLPGARFPHMWLDADKTQSTLDWFASDLTLVCGTDAEPWRAAGEQIAAGEFPALSIRTLPWIAGPFSFGAGGAALVRPDGITAWRSNGGQADCHAALLQALNHILSRNSAS